MSRSTVQETTGEGVQPVSSALLFANGSLTRFGPPKVTRFSRPREDGTVAQVALYEKVPIFRSGTFSDSLGIEREWLPEQMHQMAANFEYLRRTGIFADVPVRVGHPSFIGGNPLKDVVGYFTALTCEDRVSPLEGDDETYTYLLADYEILDPSADKKISDGLYRNRSSEIGTFFTNAPVTELWPVMMGVAYVDIPAVQGLNGFAAQHQSDHFSIQMEEPMTGTAATGTTASTPAPKPNLPGSSRAEFTIGGVSTTDTARVQAYIAQIEGQNNEYASRITSLETENAALTEFRTNAMKAARDEKLDMLARSIDGQPAKLTAPQLAAEKAFCATLSDEQFAAYMRKWDDAPGNPLLGQYGVQVTDEHRPAADNSHAADAEKAEQIAAFKDTIAAFKLASSMSDDRIKQTQAYKSLVALDPSFTL